MLHLAEDASPPPYGKSPLKFIAEMRGGGLNLVYGGSGRAEIRYKLSSGEARLLIDHNSHVADRMIDGVPLHSVGKVITVAELETKLTNKKIQRIGKILALLIPDESNAYRSLEVYFRNPTAWSIIEKHKLHASFTKDILRG